MQGNVISGAVRQINEWSWSEEFRKPFVHVRCLGGSRLGFTTLLRWLLGVAALLVVLAKLQIANVGPDAGSHMEYQAWSDHVVIRKGLTELKLYNSSSRHSSHAYDIPYMSCASKWPSDDGLSALDYALLSNLVRPPSRELKLRAVFVAHTVTIRQARAAMIHMLITPLRRSRVRVDGKASRLWARH